MTILPEFRRVLREHWRTYLALNAAVYGTLVAMAVLTLLVPGLREQGAQDSEAFVSLPGLSLVTDAYVEGRVARAALGTFLANLLFAALLTTTLPSLIIPFFGVVATIWRVGAIGVWLTPATPEAALALIPHLPVLLIELQAYVLAVLGTVILWRSTFGHRRRGHASASAGYRVGVRDTLHLYPVIVVVLLLIAIVEAVEVIWIMPLLH
ncbi:hypothetical protein [Brachybacterium sp.]|uniref:hypothetical protein n=1 Tax=Brachybacterium sp. TaxID=1891286 RepID=UPI002ED24308